MKHTIVKLFVVLLISTGCLHAQKTKSEQYLSWNASQIKKIGKQMRRKGKVGSSFSLRGIKTERAINYKLRATLLTPEMIKASARYHQLRNRLTNKQTRELVREAESAADLVVMIELDPNEGSGVIPLDWRVFLQSRGLPLGSEGALSGVKSPKLRKLKALTGVFKRDYDYDVFMIAFQLVDSNRAPTLSRDLGQIELIVGVGSKEGKVVWQMPDSIRRRIKALSQSKTGDT